MELAFSISESQSGPLHKQLYDELRKAILDGRLAPGEKLPSTRELAGSFGISRTTVAQSYDQLLDEGYLETRRGAGTFVSEQIPDHLSECNPTESRHSTDLVQYRLSPFAMRIAGGLGANQESMQDAINFRYGCPALAQLPTKLWKGLLLKHWNESVESLDYSGDQQGFAALRQAIARYVNRSRAVKCVAEQVIIVNGSQQALDLCSRLLLVPGEQIVFENPGYNTARKVFRAAGAQMLSIPVDGSGLVTDLLPQKVDSDRKLLYVTPSHQFPTGAVMTLPRRIELLAWAQRHNVVVIEDDYDSEFRFSGKPIPSLQGLNTGAPVIYVGTFSKVLFPALRLAYMIVPEPLVEVFARAKWLADRQCPILEQAALAEFIEGGHLERHIRRMRIHYDGLRKTLVKSLQKHFGDRVSILGDSAGLHVMVRLRSKHDNDEIIQRCAANSVVITDARIFYQDGAGGGEFILGYGNLTAKEIEQGVRRLARAVN